MDERARAKKCKREGCGRPVTKGSGMVYCSVWCAAHDWLRNLIRSKGVTESVAMSISGHRSRSVFDRYNITSLEDQRRALSAVAQYLEGRTNPGTKTDTGDGGPDTQK